MNRTTTAAFMRGALLGTSMLLPAAALAAPNPQYWNGTSMVDTSPILGGAGTWNATNTNWTDSTGAGSAAWASGGAFFQGVGTTNAPGAISVTSAVSTTGMSFTGAGTWAFTGSNITLTSPTTVLNVGSGTTVTMGDIMAGTAKMELSGSGTLVLTAANTWSGGTQIDAGSTLQVGAGSTTGTVSNTGAMLDNGTLSFNRSNAYTYSGVITGTGAIKQTGAGTVTLSGNSTAFAGTVTVGNGTSASALTISSGMGGVVTVSNLGTLNANAATANPVLSVVVQSGGTLAGTGFVTTATAQSGGILAGSGTVTNAIVQSGGIINGTGNITNATLSSGAKVQGTVSLAANSAITFGSGVIVAPGVGGAGVVNTLRGGAGGTLTFASGSIYQVDVTNTGTTDLLNSSGAVSIANGAKLQINEIGSAWNNETVYTIIQATNGVAVGTTGFTLDTSNSSLSTLAFLSPTLTYNPNAVLLTLTRNDLDFAAIGRSDNQMSVGAAVQSIGTSTNALYHSILVASTATAQSAFDQLSGEIHASLRGVMVDDSRLPRTAILSRLQDDNERGVWVEGFDNWGSTDIDDNAAATRHDTKGFLAGADTHILDMLRVGFAAGWSHTELEVDARNSDAVLNTIHVLGYAGVNFDALRVNAGVGYAHSNIQTQRIVSYTGYSDMLEGNYDGSILQAFGEAAYAIPFHGYNLSPFGNVAVVDAHTADFAEQGGLASLSGVNKSETSTFTTLGGRFQTPQEAEFSVTADVGWRHTFGTATPISTLELGGSSPFYVAGMSSDRDAIASNLGVAWRIWPGLTASAAYNGILSENSHDDALRIKVTQDF